MPVFLCVGADDERLLIRARSKSAVNVFLHNQVENFKAIDITQARKEFLKYAKKFNEPIIRLPL